MSCHWGEIPLVPDTDSGIAAIEREQMTKFRPMEVEGPRLHQPSSRHYPPTNESLPEEKFRIDSLTLHTIALIQHAKKLRSLIHNIQQQLNDSQASNEGDFPDPPPMPELQPHNNGTMHKKVPRAVPYLPKDMESDFVRGKAEPSPTIDDASCRNLVRRSVAALCAHAGYDTCPESVLETLTDITHEYYIQFTQHLRAAVDHQAQHSASGFPDVIEQVYHEMGIGSVTTLHDFYQKRVIAYHRNMEETCQQLAAEYEKLKEPMIQKPTDNFSVIRIKEEPSEIHFPELDEIDEVNEAEQLLNLEGLGGFEITVEHESASGLTTEVESKWSHGKSENAENKGIGLETFDQPSSMKEQQPQTPAQSSEAGDSITDPGSVPVSDIMSPPSISRPSKPKKKKKS